MDPEFRIDQTGGDAALEAAARGVFLFYFDSGFQLLNPVFRPFLQQEDAENFRDIGQHVDLNLIPQPLFPAFIKADVAPRPAPVLDQTLKHGFDLLRFQQADLRRVQGVNILTIEDSVFIEVFQILAFKVFLIGNVLEILFFRRNALIAPFERVSTETDRRRCFQRYRRG